MVNFIPAPVNATAHLFFIKHSAWAAFGCILWFSSGFWGDLFCDYSQINGFETRFSLCLFASQRRHECCHNAIVDICCNQMVLTQQRWTISLLQEMDFMPLKCWNGWNLRREPMAFAIDLEITHSQNFGWVDGISIIALESWLVFFLAGQCLQPIGVLATLF